MNIALNRIEKIVFAILKMSLHGKVNTDVEWKSISQEEWEQCYLLSVKHGVMALAWDGIQLVISECNLPRTLKLKWAVTVLNYEEKYKKYCQIAAELSDFYKENGINMLQIKGVGFSAYYPNPAHREGGDIDIYTYSSNRNKLSDAEANKLADQLMMKQGIVVDTAHQKHSNFTYKGIPIENHKTFVNIYTTSAGASINKILLDVMNPKDTPLCNGQYYVKTPSHAFNALFLSFHSAQHFGVEMNIHHLYDWACLLKKEGWCVPSYNIDERFMDFIYAMTYLSNELLGTTIHINGNERLVNDVYEQMMHAPYPEKIPVKGKWAMFIYKFKRLIYSYKMRKKVFDVAIFKTINSKISFHINKLITKI